VIVLLKKIFSQLEMDSVCSWDFKYKDLSFFAFERSYSADQITNARRLAALVRQIDLTDYQLPKCCWIDEPQFSAIIPQLNFPGIHDEIFGKFI